MPLINLIQDQRSLVLKKEREARVLVISTVAVGAVSFLTAAAFVFETGRLGLEAMALTQRKQRLAPILQQLDANEREAAQLDPRLTTLQTAVKGTQQWQRVLEHLTTNTPRGIWLNSLKTGQPDPDKGIQLLFQGHSDSLDAIGSYVLRLESSPDLEGVVLRFAQERASADKSISLEFEISATLTGSRVEKKTLNKEEKQA